MIVYLKVVGTCIGTLLRVTRGKRLQMHRVIFTYILSLSAGEEEEGKK